MIHILSQTNILASVLTCTNELISVGQNVAYLCHCFPWRQNFAQRCIVCRTSFVRRVSEINQNVDYFCPTKSFILSGKVTLPDENWFVNKKICPIVCLSNVFRRAQVSEIDQNFDYFCPTKCFIMLGKVNLPDEN